MFLKQRDQAAAATHSDKTQRQTEGSIWSNKKYTHSYILSLSLFRYVEIKNANSLLQKKKVLEMPRETERERASERKSSVVAVERERASSYKMFDYKTTAASTSLGGCSLSNCPAWQRVQKLQKAHGERLPVCVCVRATACNAHQYKCNARRLCPLRMPKQNKKETHAALVCEALPASWASATVHFICMSAYVCVCVAASFFVAVAETVQDGRLTNWTTGYLYLYRIVTPLASIADAQKDHAKNSLL